MIELSPIFFALFGIGTISLIIGITLFYKIFSVVSKLSKATAKVKSVGKVISRKMPKAK